ncbi:hypothetical protein [Pareuzebyella sediminis]|uniref:hypothetical protein n=1 Tax=Pareuzebyella sediminis TaxID=2607998 RepID=UPI0011EF789E|nr:hypothetical protein [Pareuzebyella sediminis]
MKRIFILILWCTVITTVYAQQEPIEQNENINLYAFIGEKISVNEFEQRPSIEWIIGLNGDSAKIENIPFDQGFIAKYKVIANIFNKLETDTIEFKAFDHYGRPKFVKNKYVLLYLSFSEEDSTYYHQKYQFDEVKRHKGQWTGKDRKSLKELFEIKKNGVFKNRGIF